MKEKEVKTKEKKKIQGQTIATFVVGLAIGSVTQYILYSTYKEYEKKHKGSNKKKNK